MKEFRYRADSEQATDHWGQLLAETLPPGIVVALIGTLGAGKTRLVQSIGAALGVPHGQITSPTFVLVNEYQGRVPIYHFDAYRLRDEDEFLALGPEEYFDAGGLTFIEWADRVAQCLPPDYLEIRIQVLGPKVREFVATTSTASLEPLVEEISRRCSAHDSPPQATE